MLLPLFVGFCVCLFLLFSNVLSSFCNQLGEEERAGCFTLIFFLLSCGKKCVIVVFPGHTIKPV